MKKLFFFPALIGAIVLGAASCQKNNDVTSDQSGLTDADKQLIKSAGFSMYKTEKQGNDSYLVEGDLPLTKAELQEMAGQKSTNIVVGNEEHYRTTNLVSKQAGTRTITISYSTSGLPGNGNIQVALNDVVAKYNNLGLRIKFQVVSSGGNINIIPANLGYPGPWGTSGFPSGGNPYPTIRVNSNSGVANFFTSTNNMQYFLMHEIGHCIGFRHTDYADRVSCGDGSYEAAGTEGAILIPGTPSSGTSSGVTNAYYNSWMMACTTGAQSPSFNNEDIIALNYLYK